MIEDEQVNLKVQLIIKHDDNLDEITFNITGEIPIENKQENDQENNQENIDIEDDIIIIDEQHKSNVLTKRTIDEKNLDDNPKE